MKDIFFDRIPRGGGFFPEESRSPHDTLSYELCVRVISMMLAEGGIRKVRKGVRHSNFTTLRVVIEQAARRHGGCGYVDKGSVNAALADLLPDLTCWPHQGSRYYVGLSNYYFKPLKRYGPDKIYEYIKAAWPTLREAQGCALTEAYDG